MQSSPQEIDARQPLASGCDSPQRPLVRGSRPLAREEVLRQESFAPRPPATSTAETNTNMREMNDAFFAIIQGLWQGDRERGVEAEPGGTLGTFGVSG